MPGRIGLLSFALCLLSPLAGSRAEDPGRPIRALLITGGCCHDYQKQKKILTEGISARAPVEWTIVHQGGSTTDTKIPVYENPEWARGFDVVVHNECFSGVADPSWTERILRPHRAGLPAVVIHCAMHCYRDKTDEWFKFLGVTSHGHGANYPFEVLNLAPNHPVMEGFGKSWQTPAGELYLISKLWDTATPLAHAMSRDSKKNEVCIWTNQYEKARVFGTTLGHHNTEMSDPVYLNFITRGLLWAVHKLDDKNFSAPKVKKVKVAEDLAKGKMASASASQEGHPPEHALDGNGETRWCAPDNGDGYWWQVDLGKPEEVTGCKITWEADAHYRYKVEGSPDGKAWSMLSDQTRSEETDQERAHQFHAQGVRHVRLTATAVPPGHWASFFEFEVLGTRMVEAAGPARSRPQGIGGKGLLSGIKAPPGFRVSLFAEPPEVHYPTCLTAAPTGEVFVGIDENGSIDAKPDRGRVVRCIDSDGDGKADKFNVFATMDSPRGLYFDNGTLIVLHPPDLTAYHDDNGDGVSDRSATLVKGIGFDLKHRGADHTTNGIRMGIDGWLYIAVGDYGFVKAVGKDGKAAQLRGGGIARVRPDGTNLEIYSQGQRNIYDVAIDPFMNVFTRDNTNDGGGWDVRLSQIVPTGHYGYPRLFVNFPDEIVPPLADYGGGSPCGSLYLQEPGLPEGFNDTLYTCEWGRSAVFRHPLEARGAGFTAGQEPFVELPRPTDMDVDGQSRIYVSTWREGGFTYSGPNVGYVIRVTAEGSGQPPFPNLKAATETQLLDDLASPSQVCRLHTQREILRRGPSPALNQGLEALARSHKPLAARVAAVFTLEQLLGFSSLEMLTRLAEGPALREFALRAIADLPDPPEAGVLVGPLREALADSNPRVRLIAAWGFGRHGVQVDTSPLLPLTADTDPLVAHVAVNALVALQNGFAIPDCLEGIDPARPRLVAGAARVLQALHVPMVVDGLIQKLQTSNGNSVQRPVLKALCRLYFQEAPWEGQWWGTRPDTTGPYYQPVTWEESEKIGKALRGVLNSADSDTLRWLLPEMIRNRIDFEEMTPLTLSLAGRDPAFRASAVELLVSRPRLTKESVRLVESVALNDKEEGGLRLKALKGLQRHSDQPAALEASIRAMAGIGQSETPRNDLLGAWQDFLKDQRHAKNVKTFLALADEKDPSRAELGYAVLLQWDNDPKVSKDARNAARQAIERAWSKPEATTRLLRAIGRTRAPQYALQVRSHRNDTAAEVRKAAEYAARRVDLDGGTHSGPTVAQLPYDDVLAQVRKVKGEPKLGADLFQRQGCVSCHTVAKSEAAKGPYLGDITNRYSRTDLAESILKPSAKIAQGFETQKFATVDGQTLEGFVVRESGDEVELRNATGNAIVLPKKEIDERGKSELSVMPTGLADPLSVEDLASILAYLESLKGQ